ncbi:MAG: hypothetical protein ACE5OZ_21490 [Candidatus Heimdallarchaeota archaeon]
MSMAIAERRVDRQSSRESPLATGAIGVRGPSTIRGCPNLPSEQAIMQVQPRAKSEFLWKQGYADSQEALTFKAEKFPCYLFDVFVSSCCIREKPGAANTNWSAFSWPFHEFPGDNNYSSDFYSFAILAGSSKKRKNVAILFLRDQE